MTRYEKMLRRGAELAAESALSDVRQLQQNLRALERDLAEIQGDMLGAKQIPHSISGGAMDADVRKLADVQMKCKELNATRDHLVWYLEEGE